MSASRRVMIGYPSGVGNILAPFVQSLDALIAYEMQKPAETRTLTQVTQAWGLFVAENRQRITRQFMAQAEANWLLMIDTDIGFPSTLAETLIGIAGEEIKVLAASVPLGGRPSSGFRLNEAGEWTGVTGFFPGGMALVDGIATAVCFIHRDVFAAIARRQGRVWWDHQYIWLNPEAPLEERESGTISEDLAFSNRAREAGFQIWCTYVKGLRHYKLVPLSHDTEAVRPLPKSLTGAK